MVAELLNRHTEVVVQVVVSLPQLHVPGVSAPAVNSAAAGGASVNMVATFQFSVSPGCLLAYLV